MWWEPVKFGATQVQCGKYRISKPDSEGSRPQPGHAGVMESVSRDKSANAPLADRGSECLGCGSGGVTQPAARAGVPRSDSLRLILSEPATWQTLVSRASVARPGTQEFQKDSCGKFWPWDSRSRLALARATDSISAQLGRSLGRDPRAARPGMSTLSTHRRPACRYFNTRSTCRISLKGTAECSMPLPADWPSPLTV